MYPVVFVGHGAAMFSMNEESPARKAWKEESSRIQEKHGRPKGMICVSAHFVSKRHEISCAEPLRTVHDHPAQELYSFQYPAQTGAEFADEIKSLFKQNNLPLSINTSHGLDHGAWIPLSAFFPNADVPVVLVSLLENLDLEDHFRMGEILGSLRSKGYFILTSGSATHNLGTFRLGYFSDQIASKVNSADVPNQNFQEQLDRALLTKEPDIMFGEINALTHSALYPQVHPTPEHFVPLLVAIGAALKVTPSKFHQSFQYGLSMAAYVFDEQSC